MPGHERAAREAFGNRLRALRLDAGMSGRALAEATGFHVTKVSRVEHGGQSMSDADIHTWCKACDAVGQAANLIAQMRAVDTLYREYRRTARSGLTRLQQPWVALYERTRLFRVHEHWIVPGLFQTESYSAAVMTYWATLLNTPDDRAAANTIRMRRQRVLREGDHRFVFLLAEQVLYSQVGSTQIMTEQLDRILEVMTLPAVSLGIIPMAAGLGAHTSTSFWIFDDTLVQVETITAGLDITRNEEIDLYLTVFQQMLTTAVFGRTAKALVAKAQSELLQYPATR